MQDSPVPEYPNHPQPATRRTLTANRVILILVGLILAVLLVLLAGAVVPRWWAQRIGSMVDGRMLVGSGLGLGVGMVFTAAPLVFFGVAARHLRSIGKALSALVVGLLLALPNLITLAIVLGTGNAAHAGERVLDVEAPGFRGGSLVGAIVGALLAFWVIYLMWSRRRRGRDLARLTAAEKARTAESARATEDRPTPPRTND